MSAAARPALLAVLLTGALLGVRLAGPLHMESGDQAKSAQYVLHVLATGEWLVPLEKGDKLPTKPPLSTWIRAASAAVAGAPTEAALRVPGVLAGLLFVLLTVLLARRVAEPPVPLAAGLAAGGCYLFLKAATIVRPDVFMALLVLASVLATVAALDRGGRGRGALSFVLLGLAVLAKGPAAILFWASAILPWALLARERPDLRRLAPLLGVPPFLAVVLAWAVPAFATRPELLDVMLRGELARHAGDGGEPVWQYLLVFPGRFLPWVLLLPFGIAIAWRARRDDPRWRLGLPLGWFAGSFLVMSLFASKRADYLLPLIPAAAILAALPLARRPRGAGIALAGFGLVLAGTAVAFHVFPERATSPAVIRPFVRRARAATPEGVPLLLHRPGTSANALLFHLRRAERPVGVEDVRRAVESAGRAHVATAPRGEAGLRAAGLATERLFTADRGDDGPPLLLLSVTLD